MTMTKSKSGDAIGCWRCGEFKPNNGVKSTPLLCCPFCGSKPEHESTILEEVIRCKKCHVTMVEKTNYSALVERWNKRR